MIHAVSIGESTHARAGCVALQSATARARTERPNTTRWLRAGAQLYGTTAN